MQTNSSPDAAAQAALVPALVIDHAPTVSTNDDIIEQIASIKRTVDVLASAVQSIELKLEEFIQLQTGKLHSSLSSATPKPSNTWAEVNPDPLSQGDGSSGILPLHRERLLSNTTQAEKLLGNALHKILKSIPSQLESVANVHEEIKLFVGLTMNLVPDISPNVIISQALCPYLSLRSRGSPSNLDRIWGDMQAITGCSEEQARHAFKRMIDTHCRGFRRKLIPLEQFPSSMARVMNWLKAVLLLQFDQAESGLISHLS